MHWFRDHVGSLLALSALALNLALSFDHLHAIGGGSRNALVSALTGHHDDGLADDRCGQDHRGLYCR
jgi:hypothetical protein